MGFDAKDREEFLEPDATGGDLFLEIPNVSLPSFVLKRARVGRASWDKLKSCSSGSGFQETYIWKS